MTEEEIAARGLIAYAVEEIIERGLIAYAIIYFSVHTMSGIVIEEELKQFKKGGKR